MLSIKKDTKLADIFKEYPWLKEEIIKENLKFKKLNSPMGKIIIKKATIADVSKKSGIEENKIIAKLNKMIDSHQK